ncbi:hypothetical protein [Paramagnetospirillum magneticum]|uniref:Uncharacterized protein n=1 Tax=Paramagnetospirillum magneticum (strain ATCC 700264 / AMB-1) TaxID=342108 RepID=Q2W353_PARM1|nr:hypothetical protein [Paramagnetospirillum magneticum]BAE51722.1 hypothetical protein amb2918 [Paramagnetospirillum magneticum AMB-1]
MRSSDVFLVLALAMLTLFGASFADAARGVAAARHGLAAKAEMVEQLGLTDLVLFTEARYTRHPSQADLHSAFQDHPFALDHFPSGSLLPPPLLNGPSS